MRWFNCFLVFIMFFLVYPPSYAEEEGVYILIDKSSNKLTVYLNEAPVYEFPVATGKSEKATPIGDFEIIRKVKNPWYIPKNIPGGDPSNPIGTRWLGINVPGTDGYKYGIHGTNEPDSIGTYASQGCIRMKNQDVEWLFRNIPLGTKVLITS